MAYRIAGTYTAVCDCRVVCPCPYDGPPTGPNDECLGVLVFGVKEGSLDDTDLGGVNFALFNHFPSNLTSGNWKVGIVIDEGASDAQADAIGRIMSGDEGGPFAEFAPLIADFVGIERGKVSLSNGSASVAGKAEFSFEPFTGGDGSPTTVRNAMFGFAPEYQIGKGSGSSNAFGMSFDASYGEHADFVFSSEGGAQAHTRA